VGVDRRRDGKERTLSSRSCFWSGCHRSWSDWNVCNLIVTESEGSGS
jgi:hypothetical protein